MTMNTLAKWLVMLLGGMRYPHLTEMILDDLDASTVAYVLDILGILGKCPYATKYLNPLRDFGDSVELLKQTEAEGFKALLIGPKLDLITKRIAHPRIYWEALERKYDGDAQAMWQANVVDAWVVCVHKDAFRTMKTAESVPSRLYGNAWSRNMRVEAQRAGLRQPAMDAESETSLPNGEESFIGALDLQSYCHRFILPGEGPIKRDLVIADGYTFGNNWTMELFRPSGIRGLREWVEFSYVKPLETPFRVHRPPAIKYEKSPSQTFKMFDNKPLKESGIIARFLFTYTGTKPHSFFYFEVPVTRKYSLTRARSRREGFGA